MAFNRLIYDECAVKTELNQNTSFFDAHMDPHRFVHVEPCRHEKGLVGQTSGVSSIAPPQTPLNDIDKIRGDLVALENDLRGQTRPTSKCPQYDYIPKKGEVSSKEIWKPVNHPKIKTDSPVHVDSCQMIKF